MFNLGTSELLIILAILVLLFGGKKIPEFIRSLGEAVKEYKKGTTEDHPSPPEKKE